MSSPRTARLVSAHDIGTHTRVLEFAVEAKDWEFTGGQYSIVHTGISIGGDKTAKRAYSFLSGDRDCNRFQIAVRRIGDGPGSNFMHGLAVGADLPFSGPWGKFVAEELPTDFPRSGSTLVLATDTGITAALGLVNSQKFLPFAARTDVVWLTESDEYFLSEGFVRARLLHCCRSFRVVHIPSVESSLRNIWFDDQQETILTPLLMEAAPSLSFLSGDGLLLARIRQTLLDRGHADPTIRVETFFNHPVRKAAANAVVT
jgi:ferredoxin-NADP reductase